MFLDDVCAGQGRPWKLLRSRLLRRKDLTSRKVMTPILARMGELKR